MLVSPKYIENTSALRAQSIIPEQRDHREFAQTPAADGEGYQRHPDHNREQHRGIGRGQSEPLRSTERPDCCNGQQMNDGADAQDCRRTRAEHRGAPKKRSNQRPYFHFVSEGLKAALPTRQARLRAVVIAGIIATLSRCCSNAPKLDGNSRIAKVNVSKSPMPMQRSTTTLIVALRHS